MIDRSAGDISLTAYTLYYAVLAVLLFPWAVLISQAIEDVAVWVRYLCTKGKAT